MTGNAQSDSPWDDFDAIIESESYAQNPSTSNKPTNQGAFSRCGPETDTLSWGTSRAPVMPDPTRQVGIPSNSDRILETQSLSPRDKEWLKSTIASYGAKSLSRANAIARLFADTPMLQSFLKNLKGPLLATLRAKTGIEFTTEDSSALGTLRAQLAKYPHERPEGSSNPSEKTSAKALLKLKEQEQKERDREIQKKRDVQRQIQDQQRYEEHCKRILFDMTVFVQQAEEGDARLLVKSLHSHDEQVLRLMILGLEWSISRTNTDGFRTLKLIWGNGQIIVGDIARKSLEESWTEIIREEDIKEQGAAKRSERATRAAETRLKKNAQRSEDVRQHALVWVLGEREKGADAFFSFLRQHPLAESLIHRDCFCNPPLIKLDKEEQNVVQRWKAAAPSLQERSGLLRSQVLAACPELKPSEIETLHEEGFLNVLGTTYIKKYMVDAKLYDPRDVHRITLSWIHEWRSIKQLVKGDITFAEAVLTNI